MRIDAIYFHAYPYTSREAQEKVARLASIVGRYAMGIRLTTVPFTKTQLRIKEGAPEEWNTILLRMAMMEAADRLARATKCKCLITGESVGQVASQTIENISCSESRAHLPVLRPLIGTDKQETVALAKKIGTYETSILPYEDCCVIFSPKHPILKADLDEAISIYESLELKPFIEEALRERSIERCGAPV
jgi:tRNA uracil 4-sulfurtransferase